MNSLASTNGPRKSRKERQHEYRKRQKRIPAYVELAVGYLCSDGFPMVRESDTELLDRETGNPDREIKP